MELVFKIAKIGRHAQTQDPAVILHEVDGWRQLNLYFEEEVLALLRAAAHHLKHETPYGYPVSHGLVVHLLEGLDVHFERVAIIPREGGGSCSLLYLVRGDARWTQETSDADGIAIVAATGCTLTVDDRIPGVTSSRDLGAAAWHAEHDDDLPKA